MVNHYNKYENYVEKKDNVHLEIWTPDHNRPENVYFTIVKYFAKKVIKIS